MKIDFSKIKNAKKDYFEYEDFVFEPYDKFDKNRKAYYFTASGIAIQFWDFSKNIGVRIYKRDLGNFDPKLATIIFN